MKKLFITLLILGSAVISNAQKQHELGLSFYGLNGFGMTYRVGTETALWRLNSVKLVKSSGKDQQLYLKEDKYNAFGFAAGREWRKPLAGNLTLRYGADVNFNFYSSRYTENFYSDPNQERKVSKSSLEPGLNGVFGFNYDLGRSLMLGAELNPGISYEMIKNKEVTVVETRESKGSNINFDLYNTLRLTLICKF